MFPLLYDAHHGLYTDDLPFWLELAAQQRGWVLELGCGSGRVLLPLAQAGYQLVGLDNDMDMLVTLRSHCPDSLHPPPLFFVGDICSFQLGIGFALIILPCNTWSTLSNAQRTRALVCIRAHLLSDGLFALSVPNPELLMNLPSRSELVYEESFAHPLDGSPVEVSSGWRRGEKHFTVTWRYDHLLPDGNVRRLTARVRHHLTSTDQYQQELIAVGFNIRAAYGDFSRSPCTAESSELILVAGR